MRSVWLPLICALALSGVAGACGGGGEGDGGSGGNVGGDGGSGGIGPGGSGGGGGTGGEGGTGGGGGTGGEGGTGGGGGTGGEGGTGGSGGTGGTGGTGPVITACPGHPLAPLPSGNCAVQTGASGYTLLVGDVLGPDEVFQGGEVLIDTAGVIRCVGCNCMGLPGYTGATKVTCPNGVISPGLINAHDHITYVNGPPYVGDEERYEHRHDWRKGIRGHTQIANTGGNASVAQIQYGELRFVMGGATSTNGSGSAIGFLRNLDKNDQEGLGQEPVHYQTFPLGDSGGTLITSGCGYNFTDVESDIAGDDAYTPHVAEGIDAAARNEFLCTSVAQGGGHDLMQPQTAIIHGIGLKAADISTMALEGTKLIWSPRSNIALYGETARVTEYARQGVGIALGTDWLESGSMNVLRELQCAAYLNHEFFDGYFSDYDLWRMATLGAAEAMAVDDVLGALVTGRIADVAIFAGAAGALHAAVIDAEADDVVLVLRGGQVLYGDANLVPALPGGASCDALAVCGTAKQACVSRETGQSLAALQAANAAIYPLFFCGQPDHEPTCNPERAAGNVPPLYSGVAAPNDGDGDAIPDVSDNCPGVFNPIRPMDDGFQADHDVDFVGDACDPCPLAPNTTSCPAPDPNDRDADGFPNATDVCPQVYDPSQADGDQDGKGDACDLCPTVPNPGAAACPVSIAAIKTGAVPVGANVAVIGGLVTGVHSRGFFLQTDPASPGYAGPDHTGINVFAGSAVAVQVGDRVDVTGATVADYYGQLQLTAPVFVTTASAQTLPPPVVVPAAEVATGGARAAALEGVLVQVQNVTVTNATPTPGAGDTAPTNEFEVTGGLRVNDLIYKVTPLPLVGENFAWIAGVLEWRNGNSKLEPRSGADVATNAATLTGLGPAMSWTRVGLAGPTFPTALVASVARAAGSDQSIALTSTDVNKVRVPTSVILPAGQTSVAIPVTGMSPGYATISASLGGTTLTAQVEALAAAQPPAGVSLTPATTSVASTGTATFTVSLDIPAPPAGTLVTIAVTGNGSAPASVTVPGNALGATFDFTAGAVGTAQITVTVGSASDVADVTVTPPLQGALVINEVDYDQVGTDAAEFIELYNGTNAAIPLATLEVILVNGSGSPSAIYSRISLAGSTLAPGGYLVVANAGVPAAAGSILVTLPGNTVQNGAPDAIVLFDTATATVIDAVSYEGANPTPGLTIDGTAVTFTADHTTLGDDSTITQALIRWPNGADTGAAADWANTSNLTPGAANAQ